MKRILALGLLLHAASALAGPWVDDKPGHGFVQLSYTRYSADEFFTGPGALDTKGFAPAPQGSRQHITIPLPGNTWQKVDSDYRSQDLALYGDVSFGRGFGGVVSMPLLRQVSQKLVTEPKGQLTVLHPGDLTFGVKEQVPKIRRLPGLAFGPQVYLTAPTGDVNARASYPKGYATGRLSMPTGNGTWDITTLGSFGYSFYPIPLFVSAEVGYHHHFDDAKCRKSSVTYSDDVPYNVQIGGTWAPKKKYLDHVTLIATMSGQRSLENGYVPKAGADTSPFYDSCGQQNNASAFNLGGTVLVFPIKYVGVSYTVAHTLVGVNVGYGLTQSVGLATQF